MPQSGAPTDVLFIPAGAAITEIDRDQFAAFYERTSFRLRQYLMRVTSSESLADDLVQESYIRLIHAAPADEEHRRSYLYRTATNLALDHFRALQRERAGLRIWKLWQPTEVTPQQELSGELAGGFNKMSIRERALLWLAYVEENSHAEIAAALGLRERSVRVLLSRARRKMEKFLRDETASGGARFGGGIDE